MLPNETAVEFIEILTLVLEKNLLHIDKCSPV